MGTLLSCRVTNCLSPSAVLTLCDESKVKFSSFKLSVRSVLLFTAPISNKLGVNSGRGQGVTLDSQPGTG